MLGEILNNRFRLESELGRGGMSIVYRAYDILLERYIAVKVLPSSELGAEGHNRLMYEARAVARLHHPNIVQVYDAGESEGKSYIVMQLLEGKSLYRHQPKSLDQILQIVRQICMALDHAHAHGVIHRDLKPENVIISPEGTATLTDFGLARSIVSRISVEGMIVGTVFYLSPEQALGQQIDGHTDLYALGVMMYEMVAGRLPFDADDPLTVISQHLYAPVVPPSTYRSELPPELEGLILQMMSKRPEDRPSSASEVLHRIDEIIGQEPLERNRIPEHQPAQPNLLDRLARGRLVGRERELEEVKTIWRGILAGEAQVLLISGEPGVGKTPFVRSIITLAEISGGIALVSECFPESSAPYAPVAHIIRDALQQPRVHLSNLVTADLITLAPDLRSLHPDVPPNPSLEPRAEQQRLYESLISLCATLASNAPLLLVIEDIHWADQGTLLLLLHLTRRSQEMGLRLLLVLTYRETEIREANTLNEVLLDINRERLGERIKLSRFSRQQTAQLLEGLFQEPVDADLLDAIYSETEGNLFFIEELCKALIEGGHLYREDGHWRSKGLDKFELPQSVRMTIQSRIARLPEKTQETLRLASVFGREFDFDILQKASGEDEETLIGALEQAENAQIITESRLKNTARAQGRRQEAGHVLFAFEHALIPATLSESIPSLRRRRLHRRVAEAIEEIHPEDYGSLAYHYDRSGDEEHARTNYRLAGDRASSVYASKDAIGYYTEALSLYLVDDPGRFDVLAARARVYDLTAQRDAQLADAQEMLKIAEKQKQAHLRFDALIALADTYLATDYTLAREPAQAAVSLAQKMGESLSEAQALRRLGMVDWQSAEYQTARRHIETAIDHFIGAGSNAEAAACLHMLSLVLGFQGIGELAASQAAVERALALSRQAGDRRQEATSLRRLAIVYMDQFRHSEALPYAEQALALHNELGDRNEACRALNVLGLIFGWLDRDEEAAGCLLQSLEIAESTGANDNILNAAINLSWIHYLKLGEFEGGLNFLDSMLARILQRRNDFVKRMLLFQKADFLVGLGQLEEAEHVLTQLRPEFEQLVGSPLKARALAMTGLVLAERGKFIEAHQDFDRALGIVQETERPLDRAVTLIVLARAAIIEGSADRLQKGLNAAKEAVELLEKRNWKFELGDALLTCAELHLELGTAEEALALALQAMTIVSSYPIPKEKYTYVYSRALRINGRTAEADETLRRVAQRVNGLADKIQDPKLKASWLHNVRLNRQLLAEAAAHGLIPGKLS